jgi:hypothetical protein
MRVKTTTRRPGCVLLRLAKPLLERVLANEPVPKGCVMAPPECAGVEPLEHRQRINDRNRERRGARTSSR